MCEDFPYCGHEGRDGDCEGGLLDYFIEKWYEPMPPIPAMHILTGNVGEVQDVMTDDDGVPMFYFQDHDRPSAAGWHYQSSLYIAGDVS